MKLKEGRPQRNFFSASEILTEASEQRDPQLYPRLVQLWDFLRKYVTDSERLNWDTEAACRASTREINEAAEDCGISSAMHAPNAWAALIALMNMPELCLPNMQMCNEVSREEEAKQYMNEGMRKTKEATRRSRTPVRKFKESALLGSVGDQRLRSSNLGCYCCGEFGHLMR